MEKEYNSLLKLVLEVQKHFTNFYLAGGTGLMLKHKHRISVDLDFFSQKPFSYTQLSEKLRKFFWVESEERLEDNIDFFIKGKRVSFVFYPFINIKQLENLNEIKIASDYDIFLNKIYVAGRRIDPKDPFDAAFLYKIHKWKVPKIKKDFEKKFPNQSFEIYFGALLHFEDYPKLPKWVKSTLMELIE
jgi:hypothetical protein